jgi:hypothetical protein
MKNMKKINGELKKMKLQYRNRRSLSRNWLKRACPRLAFVRVRV